MQVLNEIKISTSTLFGYQTRVKGEPRICITRRIQNTGCHKIEYLCVINFVIKLIYAITCAAGSCTHLHSTVTFQLLLLLSHYYYYYYFVMRTDKKEKLILSMVKCSIFFHFLSILFALFLLSTQLEYIKCINCKIESNRNCL